MRLLKIGSSPSCDIVLQSEFVSSYHAEIILMDNGEIILEDKNSTNGTFVANKKLSPNKEINIKRGDFVKFADIELEWSKVPIIHTGNGKYKSIINIGTNFRNDLVISGNYPSRFHATLKIDKDGKAFISDSFSKNGTKVNGIKIAPNKDVRIKKGDIVICGDVDITEQISQYIPDNFAIIKKIGISLSVAGSVAILIFLLTRLFLGNINPSEYSPAVVCINSQFKYVITLKDNPIRDIFPYFMLDEVQERQATAFFLDKEGRMATNRHVAVPWEDSNNDNNHIKNLVNEKLNKLFPIRKVETGEDIQKLRETEIGKILYNRASGLEEINKYLSIIFNSEYNIGGKMIQILVAYPGRHYTSLDEFDRCDILQYSDIHEKDLALLQLNSKKTPSNIKKVFDVSNFSTKKLEPLKEKLYTIGYPNGTTWTLDNKIKSLEPFVRETMCSKRPSKYTFEFQGESVAGTSGSPIFNQKGQLVGIIYGHWVDGVTFGLACQAKFLKEMYNNELGLDL